MAKITVTTDDGTVLETFTDLDEEIGNLDKPLARSNLVSEIAHVVRLAREEDKRDEQGAPIKQSMSCSICRARRARR